MLAKPRARDRKASVGVVWRNYRLFCEAQPGGTEGTREEAGSRRTMSARLFS